MPDQEDLVETAIQAIITRMMNRVMENVLTNDPFIAEQHHAKRPLYAALVPDEIFKSAHFERRFVTPFGKAWELLAVAAANAGLGFGVAGHMIQGNVGEERLRRITEILNELEHPPRGGAERRRPNWQHELEYVLAGGGEPIPVPVICDVYVEDRRRPRRTRKYAFELKAPLPNSDQTKVSKEKMLKLFAMEPCQIDGAFYALPYNPYGRKLDYAWSIPERWFNMRNDPVVLIGDEFWEKVGGDGAYQALIDAVNGIGPVYRERIYREFLGIEPPDDAEVLL